MNAIELLEEQHEETVSLLEKLEKSEPGAGRKRDFRKLQASLLAHMAIEEEIFYPALVAAADADGEPLAEGYEEHSGARVALQRCARSAAQEKLFQVRIGVLSELIKHHVKEERSSILPRARKAMSRDELEELGEKMKVRFQAVLGRPRVGSELDRKSTARAQRALSA
ncbi:MAG TPA: hemerythrin domain-containing protein [Polyangiales bacterium]|nr:hemerythrin domain-containing protein [Polyangiales bacterium]